LDRKHEEHRQGRRRPAWRRCGGSYRATSVAGSFARFLHALDAIIRRKPPIVQARHEVRDYDVIILGSPVWAADMATPMRSFLAREKGRISQAAFFCTQSELLWRTWRESVRERHVYAPASRCFRRRSRRSTSTRNLVVDRRSAAGCIEARRHGRPDLAGGALERLTAPTVWPPALLRRGRDSFV
jgi:hypothetical protein